MKKLLVLFLPLIALAVCAQNTQLTAKAPYEVGVGERFRLTFTLNDSIGDIRWPADKSEDMSWLEVLMGPSISRSTSYTMVNGNTTTSYSKTFTYVCTIGKKGTYAVPPASVSDGHGNVCTSKQLPILVGEAVAKTDSTASPVVFTGRPAGTPISADDLFITATIDKDSVLLGDSLTLTLKVYTQVNLTQLSDGGRPDIDACYMGEWPLPKEKALEVETYNGKAYKTTVWEKFTLVPLKTGTIVIPPKNFDCIVLQTDDSVEPFDAFFNGSSRYVEVKKRISSPQQSFTVYEK